MDARVFKVQCKQISVNDTSLYRKIFDFNSQVQQRLVGRIQENICSLDTAKQVFDLEVNGLAGFALCKGLVNPRTNAFEMARMKQELLECHHPLRMTAELRAMDNLPTPPPFLPETPPAHLFARVDREPSPDTPVPDEDGVHPWTGTPVVEGIRELEGSLGGRV